MTDPGKCKEMIDAVKAHAIANYEKDGWDYVVECFDEKDIIDSIGTARSINGAIHNVGKRVRALNEHRSEIQATVF